jgi:hypothetical protein
MIAKAATGLQRQWDNTPTLTIRGDHLDPNTDLGKVTAIVQSLDLGWKTPWRTLTLAVSEQFQPSGAKPTHMKQINAPTLQAKQALRSHCRIVNLPTPAKEEATRLLSAIRDIATQLSNGTLPHANAFTHIAKLAADADLHHAHANTWCNAAS